MARLFLLFAAVPLLDLWLLLRIGAVVGLWGTLALIVLPSLLGAWLARREGLRVLRAWQLSIAEGRVPEEGLLSAGLVLVGGVLLMTPGLITDATGPAGAACQATRVGRAAAVDPPQDRGRDLARGRAPSARARRAHRRDATSMTNRGDAANVTLSAVHHSYRVDVESGVLRRARLLVRRAAAERDTRSLKVRAAHAEQGGHDWTRSRLVKGERSTSEGLDGRSLGLGWRIGAARYPFR